MLPRRRSILITIVAAALVAAAVWVGPRLFHRFYSHGLKLVTVVKGLETPWSIAFLPDGRMLVTERPGRLRLVDRDGRVSAPLAGLPSVHAAGEGGLMGVVIDPRFAENQLVYWSYSEADAAAPALAGTAVARGHLTDSGLREVQVIFRQPEKTADDRHFGGRLLFAPDGRLFIGLGDRYQRADAQMPGSAHGKIMRIEADGRLPEGNAFPASSGGQGAVWSLGHRNVQGLAFQPGTGRLWASEHGPKGGDEVNVIQRGHNYGWPVITYGCEYVTCARIGEGTAKAGMDQPAAWFGPDSLPLTGMTFLTSDRYPEWKGQLFVGSLSWGQAMVRLRVEGDRVVARGPMWLGTNRILRDVQQGPDGWLYVVTNSPDGRILRLER
jgi:aldose sugar dehydrogenase